MFKVKNNFIANTKIALQVFFAFLLILTQVNNVKTSKVELPPHDELKCINFTKLKELHITLSLENVSNNLHQCCAKNDAKSCQLFHFDELKCKRKYLCELNDYFILRKKYHVEEIEKHHKLNTTTHSHLKTDQKDLVVKGHQDIHNKQNHTAHFHNLTLHHKNVQQTTIGHNEVQKNKNVTVVHLLNANHTNHHLAMTHKNDLKNISTNHQPNLIHYSNALHKVIGHSNMTNKKIEHNSTHLLHQTLHNMSTANHEKHLNISKAHEVTTILRLINNHETLQPHSNHTNKANRKHKHNGSTNSKPFNRTKNTNKNNNYKVFSSIDIFLLVLGATLGLIVLAFVLMTSFLFFLQAKKRRNYQHLEMLNL